MRLVGLELIHSLGLFRTHLICFRHFHSLGEVVLAQTSVRKGTGDQLAGALAAKQSPPPPPSSQPEGGNNVAKVLLALVFPFALAPPASADPISTWAQVLALIE